MEDLGPVHVPGAGYCPPWDYAKIHIRFDRGTLMACGVREKRRAGVAYFGAKQVEKMLRTNHHALCRNCIREWGK